MSLVETILSMALTIALSGTIMSLVLAGQTIARTQPEAADLQQRARIGARTIAAELRDAGAGLERGPLAGPLSRYFPAIAPSADGGVTIWRTTKREAQASPAVLVALGATTVPLQATGACPAGQAACAFGPGATAMAFTSTGCRVPLRIAAVDGDALLLAAPLSGCPLDPSSAIAEGEVRTYRVDTAARQLIRRDEATGPGAPVIDGVAAMEVAYYADTAGTELIAGVEDADLMRVRLVRVTLRFTAVTSLVRVPDLTVSIAVAPRNLDGG